MKVTFILPDFNYVKEYMSDYKGHSSLGIGYLSSCLKEAGHTTSLLHFTNENLQKKEFLNLLEHEKPDLIAFSFFTHQFQTIGTKWIIWATELKKPIICGGVHATIDPEEVIRTYGVDFVCVGEGELAIVELCNTLEKKEDTKNIKSLWVKNGNEIIRNELNRLVENLDIFPFPDKDIFDIKNIADGIMGVLTTISTRGCPYNCNYCCNHQYQKIYQGKGQYVRFRSADNVINELKINKKKYPYLRYVELLDDSFILRKDWVKEFCEKYKKDIHTPLRANTRINLVDDEILRALKEAGCERLALGIESGNEEIRKNILNRQMSNEDIIKGFGLCKKYEIETVSYNIIGNPFEKIENILETIKLNSQIKPDAVHVAIFQPYPNTKLFDVALKNNFIKNKTVSTFFGESVLEQPSVSKMEIKFAYKYFLIFEKLYEKYGNIKIFEKMLDYIFCSKQLHRLMLVIHPFVFFITNPVLATYRIMLKISPSLTRKIKKKIIGRF